ncbi:6819_t:CDS:2, partial [Cetraspora pellucida]
DLPIAHHEAVLEVQCAQRKQKERAKIGWTILRPSDTKQGCIQITHHRRKGSHNTVQHYTVEGVLRTVRIGNKDQKCNLDNESPPEKLEVETVYNLVGVRLLLGNAIRKWHPAATNLEQIYRTTKLEFGDLRKLKLHELQQLTEE